MAERSKQAVKAAVGSMQCSAQLTESGNAGFSQYENQYLF